MTDEPVSVAALVERAGRIAREQATQPVACIGTLTEMAGALTTLQSRIEQLERERATVFEEAAQIAEGLLPLARSGVAEGTDVQRESWRRVVDAVQDIADAIRARAALTSEKDNGLHAPSTNTAASG